jgi:hypothetical protein
MFASGAIKRVVDSKFYVQEIDNTFKKEGTMIKGLELYYTKKYLAKALTIGDERKKATKPFPICHTTYTTTNDENTKYEKMEMNA